MRERGGDIRELARLFVKVGRNALGIHENFKTDPAAGLFSFVPPPATRSEQFWVHQTS